MMTNRPGTLKNNIQFIDRCLNRCWRVAIFWGGGGVWNSMTDFEKGRDSKDGDQSNLILEKYQIEIQS